MIKIIIAVLLFSLSFSSFAKKARVVTCYENKPQYIKVPFNDVMVVQFPEKPNDSLPGKKSFDFKFLKNDLAIKSLYANASANLFVYVGERRCSFKLVTKTTKADDIVLVRYPKEKTVEVKYVQ